MRQIQIRNFAGLLGTMEPDSIRQELSGTNILGTVLETEPSILIAARNLLLSDAAISACAGELSLTAAERSALAAAVTAGVLAAYPTKALLQGAIEREVRLSHAKQAGQLDDADEMYSEMYAHAG